MLKQIANRLGRRRFRGSNDYWVRRYRKGRNSGSGSYGRLAEFKAQVLNDFVEEHRIDEVIEFGCGDGNQIQLATYPNYRGFDISPEAVAICRELFSDDDTRNFGLIQEYQNETAPLVLSLDVVYHLVEDDVFAEYMRRLFAASSKYVIVYSSNTDENPEQQSEHVRHRCFTQWVEQQFPEWELTNHLPNIYPYQGDDREGSVADFYFYARKAV